MGRTVACRILGCLVLILATGCASYTTPGRAANMSTVGVTQEMRDQQSDIGVKMAFDKKPLASFPTAIAVARIQQAGYRSRTAEGWGSGAYSLVTTRDVEQPEQIERLSKLPMVNGIAPMNRLLLRPELRNDQDLREAASQLHADMLLIYTFDTTFYVRDMAKPLSVISLGLSPNQQARVVTTASAVLMDTRNGYVYGIAEGTARHNQLASSWTSDDAVDDARLITEKEAFGKLVGELEHTWAGVLKQYAPTTQPANGG